MAQAINTAPIERATGKPWAEWLAWFKHIDAAGLTHKELAQKVYEQNVPVWWAEQVVKAFEQTAGKQTLKDQ